MGAPGNIARFLVAGGLVAAASLAVVWAAGLTGGGGSDVVSRTSPTAAVLLASATPSPHTATPSPRGTPISRPFALPILMYHHVSPTVPDDALQAGLTVTTPNFQDELAYLKCAGYKGVTMAQLFAALDGAEAPPNKPVILTFDDGYQDAYTQAFPLLQRYGFPASFSIITGFVGGGDLYMSWTQIQALAGAGMEMMSHSVSHPDLGTSDDDTVRQQVTESKAALEQHLGHPVPFFVYPSGEPFRSGSAERQQQVVAILQEAGYRAALLAGPNSLDQDPSQPFAFNRVRVSGGEDVYTFAGSIGGPSPDSLSC